MLGGTAWVREAAPWGEATIPELAAAARSGSRRAFEGLYRRLGERVRRTAFQIVRDEHEAEDAAHDAFLLAYRRLGSLEDPLAAEAWLLAIARNRALDHARRLARCRPSVRARAEPGADVDGVPRELRVAGHSGRAEIPPATLAALKDALVAMPRALRNALRLRYVRGLSCREIARREGVSLSCVKTRLHRARRQLEEALS